MHALDEATVIGSTDDHARGWLYFNLMLHHAGVPQSEQTDAALEALRGYHAEHNLWEHVEDDVVPCLRALREEGYRLVVVSNANGRLQRLFDRLELTQWFDALLDSHEWGVEKPDARLFHYALEHSGADPSRTVHVGDLYHVDVVGARGAGLREGVLYDAANLYPHVDCPRLQRLADLSPWLAGAG